MTFVKILNIHCIFLILLVTNSCKKYKSGTLEVQCVDGFGNATAHYALPMKESIHTAKTAERDDDFRIHKRSDERAFVYFWPDKSPNSLGYKKKKTTIGLDSYVNKDNDAKPGENGYWIDHLSPDPWYGKFAVYSKDKEYYYYFFKLNGVGANVRNGPDQPITFNLEATTYTYEWSFSDGFNPSKSGTGSINKSLIKTKEINTFELVPGSAGSMSVLVNQPFTSGSSSNITGTWKAMACSGSREQIWYFGADKTGYFTNPDCNGICNDLIFPFTYTDNGTTVNVNYTQPPVVKCTGYPDTAPSKPNNDSFTYTINGNSLNITQGSKTFTFTRKS